MPMANNTWLATLDTCVIAYSALVLDHKNAH